MKNGKILAVGLSLLFVSGMISCTKDEAATNEANSVSDFRIAMAEGGAMEGMHMKPIHGLFREMGKMGGFCGEHHWPEGAEVSGDEGTFPRMITVKMDGPPEHHKGKGFMGGKGPKDGKGPMGDHSVELTIEQSDEIKKSGAIHIIRSTMKMGEERTGNSEITLINQGQNENGEWVISIEGSTTHEGPRGTFSKNFSGTKTWKAGFDTEDCGDDIVLLMGSSNGTGEKQISAETIEPLVMDGACKEMTSGIAKMTMGEHELELDFGDGSCDAIVTITKDGKSFDVDLNERRADGRCHK